MGNSVLSRKSVGMLEGGNLVMKWHPTQGVVTSFYGDQNYLQLNRPLGCHSQEERFWQLISHQKLNYSVSWPSIIVL